MRCARADNRITCLINMECQLCKKTLAKRGSHFLCQGKCGGTFHRGCVKGLNADIKAGRNRLCCNNCEVSDGSGDDESDDEINGSASQDLNKILKDIQKKVSSIPGLKKQLESIKDCISVLSDKYDTLLAEHEQSKEKINKLEKIITNTSNKCVYLEKCNLALEQKMHDYDQQSRKNNLEIVGIEQLPGKDVKNIVTKIGETMDVSCDDIESHAAVETW